MKIKRGILVFSLSMLGFVYVMLFSWENSRILQVPILKEKEWKEICRNRQEKELEYTLYFDNQEVPWYSSALGEGYFISQDLEGGGGVERDFDCIGWISACFFGYAGMEGQGSSNPEYGRIAIFVV